MSKGWVGHIPLAKDLSIALKPKVELTNIFHMLEYAYRLKSFKFLDGITECESLDDFYEQLAKILALRILDRSRKGYYREYIPENERLPYVRGKLNIESAVKRPWNVKLKCRYEDHIANIPDNQILLWTLYRIAKSGRCTDNSLSVIRRSFRSLQGFSHLVPCNSASCRSRIYNRLNDDYKSLHALCAFFLDQEGPSHELGSHLMLPFLINMSRLYELFVAEWLKKHLPSNILLQYQESISIGIDNNIGFNIDMVLYDLVTAKTLCVIDTKYKSATSPSPADIAQVITYSEVKESTNAVLVYPQKLTASIDEKIGDNRIRDLAFSLDGDLESNGQKFLDELLPILNV
jgi:5-methylcytosine-specific restriction enzyme subunit McrC